MHRRSLALSGGLVLAAAGLGSARAEPGRRHKLLVHVASADPDQMAMALHNIRNAADAYAGKGEAVDIELVANGGGFDMLWADKSPVRDLLAETHRRYPAIVFAACQATRAGVARSEGKTIDQIIQVPEASSVPFGVVRIVELQEQGWAYMRV